MRIGRIATILFLLVYFSGCDFYHRRPKNVPVSAIWVDHVFIDCAVEKQWDADRCAVYKDDTGEILADGLWVLESTLRHADTSRLRYIAYGHDTIYFDNVQFLMLTFPSERDPQIRLLEQLATLGDKQVIDCNRIPNIRLTSEVSKCALKAFAARKPFYARYVQPGVDSSLYHALASDSQGNVTEVNYDSRGFFKLGELFKKFQVFDDGHIIAMPCPRPVHLAKAWDGTLDCVRPPTSFK